MFQYIKNERGLLFPLAIVLLFIVITFVTFFVISYESQIKTYNSLEFANVRATINLLKEINSK